jgi:hypothetical protein
LYLLRGDLAETEPGQNHLSDFDPRLAFAINLSREILSLVGNRRENLIDVPTTIQLETKSEELTQAQTHCRIGPQ